MACSLNMTPASLAPHDSEAVQFILLLTHEAASARHAVCSRPTFTLRSTAKQRGGISPVGLHSKLHPRPGAFVTATARPAKGRIWSETRPWAGRAAAAGDHRARGPSGLQRPMVAPTLVSPGGLGPRRPRRPRRQALAHAAVHQAERAPHQAHEQPGGGRARARQQPRQQRRRHVQRLQRQAGRVPPAAQRLQLLRGVG